MNNFHRISSKFVTDNEWLIYYCLSKYPWVFRDEDTMQEARIWLLEAKTKYVKSKSSWKTFASHYIQWMYKNNYRNNNTKAKNPVLSNYEIVGIDAINENDLYEISENVSKVVYEDIDDKITSEFVNETILEGIVNIRTKDIIRMILHNYKQHEIAEKYNISKQRVQQIYKAEMIKIKERMNKVRTYKVYISGPMKGKIDLNRLAFKNAEAYIKNLGHVPINPHNLTKDLLLHDPATKEEIQQCMKIDLQELLDCDAIHLLDGYENSVGAMLEYSVAKAIGLKVI